MQLKTLIGKKKVAGKNWNRAQKGKKTRVASTREKRKKTRFSHRRSKQTLLSTKLVRTQLTHRPKHDSHPQSGLLEEKLPQGRQAAHLFGQVVRVDLEVHETLDALGIVSESPVVLGLINWKLGRMGRKKMEMGAG